MGQHIDHTPGWPPLLMCGCDVGGRGLGSQNLVLVWGSILVRGSILARPYLCFCAGVSFDSVHAIARSHLAQTSCSMAGGSDDEGPKSSKRQSGHNEATPSYDDGTQPTFVATGRVDDGTKAKDQCEATSRGDDVGTLDATGHAVGGDPFASPPYGGENASLGSDVSAEIAYWASVSDDENCGRNGRNATGRDDIGTDDYADMFAGLGRDVPSAEYLKWFTEGTCEATSRDDGGTTKDQCDATSRVDEGKTKDQHEATSRDDEHRDYDVCPRCGVYRVFAGMSEECCDQEFGMPCVFDMIQDHDQAPAESEPRHDPAMAAVLTTKATSMATSAMPPVGTTMAAITMDPTAKDLCEATDTDEGTQQGSRRQRRPRSSGGRPRSRSPAGPRRWALSLARSAEATAACCRQRPSGSMHQLGESSSEEDVGGY